MKNERIRGNTEWYISAFSSFEKGLNGQTKIPFHKHRKNALSQLNMLGFPTTKHEDWKYTNLDSLLKINFEPASKDMDVEIDRNSIKKFLIAEKDFHLIVFINGSFSKELTSIKSVGQNIIIDSLNSAFKNHSNLINDHIGKYTSTQEDSFTALNTAFSYDGAFVYLPENAKLEKPVQFLFLSDSESQSKLHTLRNLFIAENHSQATIIETYAGLSDNTYFTNTVSEIIADENSQIDHFKIQSESNNAFHIGSTFIHQDQNSNFTSNSFSFGGKLVRNNLNSILDGEGIECIMDGLYIANENQLIDNHTSIDHAKPHCQSHELYKGILDDKARGVFSGKIMVRKDAQKTNAVQSNNCVLLSDDATIDTKPQLEIYADDVKCTHGATVGQLDDDAFFYMRSRGIGKKQARELLIYAFASDVVDRIKSDSVREKIAGMLSEKLTMTKAVEY